MDIEVRELKLVTFDDETVISVAKLLTFRGPRPATNGKAIAVEFSACIKYTVS